MEQPDQNKEKNSENTLTCIHDAYTLYAKPEDNNEADEVMVKQFLKTLAEIALAVATRKIKER